MAKDLGIPRHAFWLRWLKRSLRLGAIYDLVFAGMMVFAPHMATQFLDLRPPEEPYYLWLIAVFLFMLAGIYFLAAYDPEAYRGNVDIAVVGRTLGFVAMAAGAWGRPEMWGLWVLAFGDLFFAAAHFVCWIPVRR